jgi:hypothetical protein
MEAKMVTTVKDGPAVRVPRWIARIWSVLSVGVLLLFLVGEGFDPSQPTLHEWVMLLFFPCGVAAGMILAWWKEGWGGALTVVSLFAFYAYDTPSDQGIFLIFAGPGFLFLAAWFLARVARAK